MITAHCLAPPLIAGSSGGQSARLASGCAAYSSTPAGSYARILPLLFRFNASFEKPRNSR